MKYLGGFLWAQLGSNQRPPDYECYFFNILSDSKKLEILKYLKHLQGFMFLYDYN
jgi:hypothetical protein